jgi:putative oxidoreductase
MTDQTRNALYVPAMAGLYDGVKGVAYPWVRFWTGIFLMPHGAQKLFGMFGGNIENTAGFFSSIGLEPALLLAYVVGVVEFFGGLLLAIGLFTRIAAAAIVVLLLVATIQVHLANGFFWTNGGYEYPLLWALIAATFVLGGSGRWSVDGSIGKEF